MKNFNQFNQVQVHSLSEERSLGFANYKLDVCGTQNLGSVSRKMVLNKQ